MDIEGLVALLSGCAGVLALFFNYRTAQRANALETEKAYRDSVEAGINSQLEAIAQQFETYQVLTDDLRIEIDRLHAERSQTETRVEVMQESLRGQERALQSKDAVNVAQAKSITELIKTRTAQDKKIDELIVSNRTWEEAAEEYQKMAGELQQRWDDLDARTTVLENGNGIEDGMG